VLLGLFAVAYGDYRPVVLMHGIAAGAGTMDLVATWIQDALPGIYVKNVEIGDGYWSSFFTTMNDQVSDFCGQIAADEKLQNGFNLIGYSQGGLITRGFIERCNYPNVYNYITWSSPHGGEFGIPNTDWSWIVEIGAEGPYESWVQESFSWAGYWKDPYDYDDYLEYCQFLPDINNERDEKNMTYKKNIMSLNNFVLLYSTVDTIIIPKRSGWFEFFLVDSQNQTTVPPLRKSDIYVYDWIGLKYLDQNNRLLMYTTNCPHTDYPHADCKKFFTEFTLPYLNNTL